MCSTSQALGGSSPLARGLRGIHEVGDNESGIIPARAGFTIEADVTELKYQDHPRSRGVYAKKADALRRIAGSSPLARGLLRIHRMVVSDIRIIPARAGFTLLAIGAGAAF